MRVRVSKSNSFYFLVCSCALLVLYTMSILRIFDEFRTWAREYDWSHPDMDEESTDYYKYRTKQAFNRLGQIDKRNVWIQAVIIMKEQPSSSMDLSNKVEDAISWMENGVDMEVHSVDATFVYVSSVGVHLENGEWKQLGSFRVGFRVVSNEFLSKVMRNLFRLEGDAFKKASE